MDVRRLLLLGVASVGCCLSTGCGYSSKRPFATNIETVHVEMVQSREFRRDLEFHLTEALVKRINMDTPVSYSRQKQCGHRVLWRDTGSTSKRAR